MPPLRVNSQEPRRLFCRRCRRSKSTTAARTRWREADWLRFSRFQTLLWFFTERKRKIDGLLYNVTPVNTTFPLYALKQTVLWKQNQNFSSVLPRSGSVSRTFSTTQTGKTCVLFRRAKPIISTLDLGVPDEIHPSSQFRHSGSIPFSNC